MRRSLCAFAALTAVLAIVPYSHATDAPRPTKVLIITSDTVGAHDRKGTTEAFQDILGDSERSKCQCKGSLLGTDIFAR